MDITQYNIINNNNNLKILRCLLLNDYTEPRSLVEFQAKYSSSE